MVNPACKTVDTKKMADGKGGNLKTIHHYKTERVYGYHATFQIIFEEIAHRSADLQSTNPISASAASFRKEKGLALVPIFLPLPFFGPFFRFGLRNDFLDLFLILSQKKIILMNSAGGDVAMDFFAAPQIILLFFSIHESINSIPIAGGRFVNLFMILIAGEPSTRLPFTYL